MGELIGGTVACILLGLLLGMLFKKHDPDTRALYATLSAWIAAGVLAGFGMANGGGYRWDAILIYLPAAAAAYFFLRWNYKKTWVDDDI